MSFRLKIRQAVVRQLATIGLPDSVLVSAHLSLRERLAADPIGELVRVQSPFDGMAFPFSMVDPENRFVEHQFAFHVFYHSDEETLIVARVAYLRIVGF